MLPDDGHVSLLAELASPVLIFQTPAKRNAEAEMSRTMSRMQREKTKKWLAVDLQRRCWLPGGLVRPAWPFEERPVDPGEQQPGERSGSVPNSSGTWPAFLRPK